MSPREEIYSDLEWDRLCAAAQANLARYLYDETGQCVGRCRGHDTGDHHTLCPDYAVVPDEDNLVD